MSFVRQSTARTYIGHSGEVKPRRGVQADGSTISTSDLPQGSTFIEIDTGYIAVYDGDLNSWTYIPKPPREDVVGKLDELLTAIGQLNETQKQMLLLMAGGSK